jgi:hypothetical protein
VIEVEIKSRIFFAETEIKPNEISIQIETCQIRTLVYSHKKRAVVKRQPPSNKNNLLLSSSQSVVVNTAFAGE